MSFEKDYKNPGCEFRGKPFWAWNGKLEKNELVRQLGVFKEMGLGGAFMHARVGLGTPYLSNEWFDLVDACAQKAKAEGMEAWLYDEDRWPSGAAGGLVTKDERYRMRFLRLESFSEASAFKADGKEIALFAAKISVRERVAKNVRRIANAASVKLEKGETLLVFREELHPLMSWYNGYTYLDTMNEEAVDKFIEVTHAQYQKHNGKDYGKTIPGIFADEPHYGHGRNFNSKTISGTAQWTGKLPETFRKRCGYDLLDKLPELFFFIDGKKFSEVRRDYYDCITWLFVNAFGRKIFERCEKDGIEFTGHVLEEQTLISQTQAVGAAMRFYEFMQAPGIDILCAQGLTREGGREPELVTAKQCESMRHQFGRKRMLSELYGCTGWNFTFAEHKAVGDWQAAMGVNLRCQHLAWYTMEGEAKRDYPASISFQSAWCKEYKAVEDYFARVGAALAQGSVVRDVAMLHPIESVWGSYLVREGSCEFWDVPGEVNDVSEKLDKLFLASVKSLLRFHCDFDFVDEDVMARHGAAEGAKLKVKLASYKAVVIPPLLRVRESTAKILTEFAKAGGSLFMIENDDKELSALEQGGALDELKKIAKKIKLSALPKALAKTSASCVSVKSVKDGKEYQDCLYMLRRDEKAGISVLFVTHNLQDKGSGELEIAVPAVGKVYELDAASGRIVSLGKVERKDGKSLVRTSLASCGSRLFLVEDDGKNAFKADAEAKALKKLSSKALALKGCEFTLSEPNAIALDLAEYKTGESWNGPVEILKLDRVVRDVAGLPYRCGNMVQPWARKPVPGAKEGKEVELSLEFKVEELPEGKAWIVMEKPEQYELALNGEALPLKDEGWWIDPSFRKIAIPAKALRLGWNRIWLKTRYTADSGFEYAYLLGNFGAKRDEFGHPVIVKKPAKLGLGDWADYGLESFTGALGYVGEIAVAAKKGERTFVKLGAWKGVMAKVLIDGKAAGSIAWAPFELDVTDAVAGKKTCKIEIQVFAGRRNLLGPLHLTDKNPGGTGPGEYVAGQQRFAPTAVNFETGLFEAPVVEIRG